MTSDNRNSPEDPPSTAGRPSEWVAAACATLGEDAVVDWCIAVLTGESSPHDPELPSLDLIGGPGAALLAAKTTSSPPDLWPRAWAIRALRYAWREDFEVERAVVRALADESWRVRETAAAVVGLREIGPAADRLLELLRDDVPRVRAAAARALGSVGEHEHLDAVTHAAREDPAPQVVRAAARALAELQRRLDLPAWE